MGKCCGEGHLSKELIKQGYKVYSSDLVNRGYGETFDFLKCSKMWHGDIITNPPYKFAKEFVEKSIELINKGNKIAMFLKQFLESQARKILFTKYPPKIIYAFQVVDYYVQKMEILKV